MEGLHKCWPLLPLPVGIMPHLEAPDCLEHSGGHIRCMCVASPVRKDGSYQCFLTCDDHLLGIYPLQVMNLVTSH